MPQRDSIDKMVVSYFAAVNAEAFEYKDTLYPVKRLTVSPLLLRGYTCPAGCGGCCSTFSLDYLPQEKPPYALTERFVSFNGVQIRIMSHTQNERKAHHCSNLNMDNGRCNIHGRHPFSCDFELTRFLHYTEHGEARLLTRLYGRGHAFLRIDGERGAMCTITPPSVDSVDDTTRKLKRLAQWAEHFKLKHRIGMILDWISTSPMHPLVLPAEAKAGTGFFN